MGAAVNEVENLDTTMAFGGARDDPDHNGTTNYSSSSLGATFQLHKR